MQPLFSFRFSFAVTWFAISMVMMASTSAQPLYVTNFDSAMTTARESRRMVILYTGRSVFCDGKTPRSYFFDVIVGRYPKITAPPRRYVICEQFAFATNHLSPESWREYKRFSALSKRYSLRQYAPTLTVLDAQGNKLNGPFYSPDFDSRGDDCYDDLRDYLDDDPPLRLEQAQSNLVAAVFTTNVTERGFTLMRCRRYPEGGQNPLLLDNGLLSRRYALGAPFSFIVRETALQRGNFSASSYEESFVATVGRFEGADVFTGNFMIRLNGAWFRAVMESVGSHPDHFRGFGNVALQAGEYYFGVWTRDKSVGAALLAEMQRLGK